MTTIERAPELGNMRNHSIIHRTSDKTDKITSLKPNAILHAQAMSRMDMHGNLVFTHQAIEYRKPTKAINEIDIYPRHVRDSAEGRNLLKSATISCYAPGTSGKYNPYSKEAMKPLPEAIIFCLDELD